MGRREASYIAIGGATAPCQFITFQRYKSNNFELNLARNDAEARFISQLDIQIDRQTDRLAGWQPFR